MKRSDKMRYALSWCQVRRAGKSLAALVLGILLCVTVLAASNLDAGLSSRDGGIFVTEGINVLQTEAGDKVRLAGINIPKTALAKDAEALLTKMTADKTVRLLIDQMNPQDRHGRMQAQIYVMGEEGQELWVQKELLAAGMAYADIATAPKMLLPALLEAERDAKSLNRGIWAYPLMHDIPVAKAWRYRDQYVFVTGRVRSAATRGDKIYLNFGTDWRRDFTAVVAKNDWRNFTGMDLLALGGKAVRLRGFLYEDNGPMLGLHHPAQIEIDEKGGLQ